MKILFLPVSSPLGSGEYMRSRALARGLRLSSSDAEIAFGLNRNAGYFQACEFQCYPLSASPTQCTDEVIALIDCVQPTIVVFDASGRKAQLQYCVSLGIKTVFIAQHQGKLNRAMGLRRLRYTDLIIVAQPVSMMKPLSWWDKRKLEYMGKRTPRYVGPIYDTLEESREIDQIEMPNDYLFFCAGGGGNVIDHAGEEVNASDLFLEAAGRISKNTQSDVLVILGPNYPSESPSLAAQKEAAQVARVKVIKECSGLEFNRLLRSASCAVLGGGSSLLQAIASGQKNIVAVPVAKDQFRRVSQCEKQFGVAAVKPSVAAIEEGVKNIDNRGVSQSGEILENGLDKAVSAIMELGDRVACGQ